jgi:hypothetical protein
MGRYLALDAGPFEPMDGPQTVPPGLVPHGIVTGESPPD